jgi:hypothetical protein
MVNFKFDRPVPGQSLTADPGKYPYERPPEINDPEEAMMYHVLKLSEPKVMKSAFGLLEQGVDLVTLVEGILRNGVANGIHSIDVSMIIAPTIHEYIKDTADAVGIEYDEGVDEEGDTEGSYKVNRNIALKKLTGGDTEAAPEMREEIELPARKQSPREDPRQLSLDLEDEQEQQEPMPSGKGLMSRGM